MKKLAIAAYTALCLALGGLLFHGITQAGGYIDHQYFSAHELGAPQGYRACLGVNFKNGITRPDVLVDWKSQTNFIVYMK